MTEPNDRALAVRSSVLLVTALGWAGAAHLVARVGVPEEPSAAPAPTVVTTGAPSPTPLAASDLPPAAGLAPAPHVVRRVVVVRRSRAS